MFNKLSQKIDQQLSELCVQYKTEYWFLDCWEDKSSILRCHLGLYETIYQFIDQQLWLLNQKTN